MPIFNYKFSPDALQFYLLEEGAFEGVYEAWTHEEAERNLWLREGALGIWTYPDMTVMSYLTIEICDFAPGLEEGDWQRINDCSLKFRTGAWGLSYWGWPGRKGWDVTLFAIEPGSYRARIYYGDQSTVAEKIALDLQVPPANDEKYDWREHFKIVLWPAPLSKFKCLKSAPRIEEPQRVRFQHTI